MSFTHSEHDLDPPYIYRSWRTVCTVSFLIYAALGSVIPMLTLFLRTSTALPWWQTGLVFAALPMGSTLALPAIRAGRRSRSDPRLSTALGQLFCSAITMGIVIVAQNQSLVGTDWRIAASIALSYGTLVAWTQSWLHELAGQTAPTNPQASREWRLWGAVGFVLPAWGTELAIGRVTFVVWDQFEVLLTIAAWSGLAAVLILVLAWRQETSVKFDEPASGLAAEKTPVSGCLVLAMLLMVVVQRCHELWLTPFIERVLEQHAISVPLTLRLSVVSHVAEVTSLYALGRVIWLIGPRFTLLVSLLFWLARCWALGLVSQTPLNPRDALTSLFVAQVLGGMSTVLFFGTVAVVVGRDLRRSPRGLGSLVAWSGLVAAIAVGLAGYLTQAATDEPAPIWAQRWLTELPERITVGSQLLILREWSGLWFCSAVFPLIAMPLIVVARLRSVD